jgi:carbamoylphosphate synthase large subunit
MSRDLHTWPLDGHHTVWVGAAGTGIAFGTLKSIRESWGNDVTVVAADINPPHLIAAAALADRYVVTPPFSEVRFPKALLEALAEHAVDTYFPILDEEIVIAATMQERGELPDAINVLAPPAAAARICLDKLGTAQWLSANGLPSPETWNAADARWRTDGLILKPRRGRGSLGVRTVESPEELELYRAEGLVAQERCALPEITIDAFRSRSGKRFRALCRERIEVKAGVCTKARVFEDAQLMELAAAVAEGLRLVGTFCLQVMRGQRSGGWVVTDVNPRPGAGTRMSTAVGVDFLAANLADAWGIEVTDALLPVLKTDRYVVRQHAEYVL